MWSNSLNNLCLLRYVCMDMETIINKIKFYCITSEMEMNVTETNKTNKQTHTQAHTQIYIGGRSSPSTV